MASYDIGYLIGSLVGGVVIIYLITRVVLVAFRDKKHAISSIVLAAGIALLVATVLAGYGMSEGGSPNFPGSFFAYLIQTLIVIGIEITRVRRLKAKADM
jgi:FtsH-binding integral membrane protein